MTALTPGTTLGPYEIVAPLGAGGMGEVYRARDARLDRDVALKVLAGDVASDPDRLARFEREAKTIASLNHPHIVTIHSIEAAGGVRFLTMELIEGQSLDRIVGTDGVPLSRALDLSIALADALAAAHDKGVVHRDLKPSNVMVTRDGRLKVLDFGLAKALAQPAALGETQALTMAPISSVGQVVGTVPYMAPEQVRGEAVDARADLFSFGILVYELVTGRRPFGGKTFADVSSSILRDAPEPIQRTRSDLPRDLDRIVSRCLEKDRERRFQTAKDIRNELELLRGESSASKATRPAPSAGATRDLPSIAVLPFVNRSRDEEDEYFSDGLADELLSVLAKIRGLRVAARTSSSTFKGKSVTIAEAGRALNVATVLEGSVRKSGNRVRIAVQLVQTAGETLLWSETYDRTLEDIFALQDEIAQAVVKELRTTLLGEVDSKTSGALRAEVAAAAAGRGENADAQRLYLQGRYFIDRLNQQDTEKGVRLLLQALERDPSHARAWVSLSHAYHSQGGYGWAPVEESSDRARAAALRAIELAPDLAEAHAALGRTQSSFEWNWAEAEKSFRRALELDPNNAEVLPFAGLLHEYLGRHDEALACFQRAVELDPLSSTAFSRLGLMYRALHRYPEALEALGKALELTPQRIVTHMLRGIIFATLGQDAEAMAEAAQEPADWARQFALAVIHYTAGRAAESEAALRQLERESPGDSAYQIAVVHAYRGENDAAFEWLERARLQRDGGLPFVAGEQLFAPVHDDPRWLPFLRQMGLRS